MVVGSAKNAIGSHSNVIPAAGRVIAHAGDHRFDLLQGFNGIPNVITRHPASTWAVHPKHNCIDGCVFFQITQNFYEGP